MTTSIDPIESEMARQPAGPISHGHLAYREAKLADLVMLPNGQFLHPDAARAFLELSIRAASDGIYLIPRSAFRSHRFQRDLFLLVARRDGLSFAETVRQVALPGYSEHHTGFAVDIDRGPFENREMKFEETRAYRWLSHNAASFGFRNSFPRDNVFGVAFEPWHWRWEGSPSARDRFRAHIALDTLMRRNVRAPMPLSAAPADEVRRILSEHERSIAAG